MQQSGKLHSVGEMKTFDSGFMVQEFYLDLTRYNQLTGEKYSNHAKFKVFNENINLDSFNQGDIVKVDFRINGRSFAKEDGSTGFAQDLVAYKMELVKSGEDVAQKAPEAIEDEENDDLPF